VARQSGVQQVEPLREPGYEADKIHFCTDNQGAETAVVAETITPLMKPSWTKELVLRKQFEEGLLDVVKIPSDEADYGGLYDRAASQEQNARRTKADVVRKGLVGI